jgi:hypothetical protein
VRRPEAASAKARKAGGNDARVGPSSLFSVDALVAPLPNLRCAPGCPPHPNSPTSATSARSAVPHAARSPRRRDEAVPEIHRRYHLLGPAVKCPACGAGLTFVRVRGHRDLYSCASGGTCKCHVMHYWNKETKVCGYAVIYNYGPFGLWTVCSDVPARPRK